MRIVYKVGFILPLLLFISFRLFAQVNDVKPDEGMDIFILVILSIFFSVMIGAAIVGTMASTFIFLVILGFIALGILSTSLAVGIYKRSIAAGFKSVFVILSVLICSFIGLTGLLIFNYFFPHYLSLPMLCFIGIIGGGCGGIIIGITTLNIFQKAFYTIAKKLQQG